MNLDPNIFPTERHERICSVSGCGRKHRTGGLCNAHHQRQLRGKPLNTPLRVRRKRGSPRPPCSVSGCYRETKNLGLCAGHYRRKVTHGRIDWARPLKAYRAKGSTKDVSARISVEAIAILEREARSLDIDRAELIRLLLEGHAAQLRKPLEAA